MVTDAIFSLHPDLKRLLRAMQLCSGFGLYFARCNTIALRHELVATLKSSLNKPIIELSLNPNNDSFIDVQMSELLVDADDNAVVFIYDLDKLFNLPDRPVIQELNWRRGFYGRSNHAIVFWLPEFLLTEIFNNAPDFADWYSGIYEFSLSKPEQVNLMTSTWQTANENFVGQLSLQEKERWIINLQNLLAEVGEQDQSKTKSELLNRLGQLYNLLGKYDKALACYQQNLQVQQDLGDKQGEGTTLNNLATIAHVKGDFETALRYLTDALKIRQSIGDKEGEGTTLNNLATTAHAKGDYDSALRYLPDALKISQDIGDKKGEGTTLNNLAIIAFAKGDYDTALRYLTDALKIRQDLGDKQGVGATFNNISQIYDVKGDYDTALRYLTDALEISQDIGDKQGVGTMLNNISQIYRHGKGDNDSALRYLTDALKIQQDIGDKQGVGTTLNNLAAIDLTTKGDYDSALHYLTDSLKIQQDIGDTAGQCATLFNIGHIHLQNDEQPQAMENWLKVYQIAKQIGLAQTLAELENLAKHLGGDGLDFWETLSQAR